MKIPGFNSDAIDFGDVKMRIKDAIGKNIICEDGVPRRVVEIVPSVAFKYRSIINEKDPDSQAGYFVNNLSLACQLLNKPLPGPEQLEAFINYVNQLEMRPRSEASFNRARGRWIRSRGGIFVPN